MRSRLSFLGLVLFVSLLAFAPSPAPAQDAGEDLTDLREFDPADLGATENRKFLEAAHRAYGAGDFANAARAFIKALKVDPGDSNSLYNLACCFGLLDLEEQAARVLTRSWQAGFDDLEHIRNDPDFEAVRESEAFRAAMDQLAGWAEERAKTAGKQLEVVCSTVADVRVLAPDGVNAWQKLPLVIGLHGLGDNGEHFARLFAARGVEQPFLYVAAQAPYAFPTQRGQGFSWSLREPGAANSRNLLSHRLSSEYVLAVLAAVKREYPVDEGKVFLLGFSQGAGMAFSVGMQHPELFAGVIPVGGWLDPGEHPAERVTRAAEDGLFLVCHATDDQVVTYDHAATAVKFLAENDIPFQLITYRGGHSLPKDLIVKICEWMKDPSADAPEPEER